LRFFYRRVAEDRRGTQRMILTVVGELVYRVSASV
jgi:hypothetical protein